MFVQVIVQVMADMAVHFSGQSASTVSRVALALRCTSPTGRGLYHDKFVFSSKQRKDLSV